MNLSKCSVRVDPTILSVSSLFNLGSLTNVPLQPRRMITPAAEG